MEKEETGVVGWIVFLTVGTVGAFGAFIVWARTATGQKEMKARFGETHSFQKRQRMAKKRAASQGTKSNRSTKRPAR